MANPAGESNDGALRLDFDRRLMLQFRGSARRGHHRRDDLGCDGWREWHVVPLDKASRGK